MKQSFLYFSALYGLSVGGLFACTGVRLTSEEGVSVTGRTVEFGIPIEAHAAVIPRNYSFIGQTPKGPGLAYRTKYAAVGVYGFKNQVLMDGMNEKGLVAAAFYFPGFASYVPLTEDNRSKALSPVEFPNWILTQFASLDEVKQALDTVVIVPTVASGWGPEAAPFHYIVYDKLGKSLVIEPINGTLVTYENKIGCFTNSPTFDWHMNYLRQFINLSPINAAPQSLRGVELTSFGQGAGLVGLPGDFTPPSRFVRAALFSSNAVPVKTSPELINQVFHLLNQFDIPKGIARSDASQKAFIDYTMLTTVKDPDSLRYYFTSYDDTTVKSIDLKRFDLNAKTIKTLDIIGTQKPQDVSKDLK